MLAVVVFALLLGVALVKGVKALVWFAILPTILCHDDDACRLGNEACTYRYFALLAKLIATEDLSVLSRLLEFAVVVTGTTIFHGAVVLPALLWILVK